MKKYDKFFLSEIPKFNFFKYLPSCGKEKEEKVLSSGVCLYRKSWKGFPRKRYYLTQFLCLSLLSGKKKANFANL